MKLSEGSKGKGPISANYACGGPVFNSRSKFYKEPDIYRAPLNTEKRDYGAKKDPLSKKEGDTKKEKAIKPRT
jgi:hypothetical protein